jgi:hypothetical protein
LGLVYDFYRVFDHLRIQHAADHFVKLGRLWITSPVRHF